MPKGKPLTEEQKAAMKAGRQAAIDRKKAEKAAEPPVERVEPIVSDPLPPAVEEPEAASSLLSDAEMDRIREEARKKVDAELAALNEVKKKEAMKDALDAETLSLRRQLGLTNAGDDIIEFLVNVAPFSPGLVIDGKTYQHGQWAKTTRRQYDSFRDIMSRSWESEDRAGNPNKRFEAERRLAGVQNPMLMEQRMADGTFTIGLQTSVNARTGAQFGVRGAA